MKNLNIPNRLSILRMCLVPVCVLLWLIRGIFAAVDWCSLRLKSA